MNEDLDNAVAQLLGELRDWRAENHAPARIPEELWNRAAGIAAHLGVCKTAKALGLGYASLKKRMSLSLATPERPGATFVEWLSPIGPNISECSLTIESSRGATLRVSMKGVAPVSVAQIIREFAG